MGEALGSPVKIRVNPRIQKDKWSLYWKESMETKTDILPMLELEVSPSATVSSLHALVAAKLGWANPEGSQRLEGFKDPWDMSIFKGRLMVPSKSLESHGVAAGSTLTTVRRVLVPEDWKILEEGQDEDDLSSDEEW